MPFFHRKCTPVEAWQFNGEDRWQWPAWLKANPTAAFECDDRGRPNKVTFSIPEGRASAQVTDWIVKSETGRFYTVEASVFAAFYEPA